LYRLNTTFKYPNSPEQKTAQAAIPMGPYLQQQSPDVENYCRIVRGSENYLCRANRKEKTIAQSIFVDSTFFSLFNFELIYGKPEDAFSKLENILITRSVSEDFFGKENPIGQSMEHTFPLNAERDTTISYIVAGVFEDIPSNSHIQFESLIPLDDRQWTEDAFGNYWHSIESNTYLQLRPTATDPQKVAAQFPSLLEKEMPGHDMIELSLQPLREVHLDSSDLAYDYYNYQSSNRKYLNILAVIAIFILLISSINFANLSTVLAMKRVQEVGVRKSLGARNSDVLFQFLGEAVLMALIGGGLALLWVIGLRKPFLDLLGRNIQLEMSTINIVIFVFAIMLLGLVAGLFPAIQAARYSAVEAFKRFGTSVSIKRPFIQRLVVLQFVLSGMLIIGSIICYQQLDYMQNKDLGFQYDQIVELELGYGYMNRASVLKKEMAAIPEVASVSGSESSLGAMEGQRGVGVRNEETEEIENYPMMLRGVNSDFFDLYKIQFALGQAPTLDGENTGQEIVVNESFVKRVGWKESPIGKEVFRIEGGASVTGRVVGVIKDIHHNSLYNKISPVCFFTSKSAFYLSLKINPKNLEQALPKIESVWNQYIKDRPFDYEFKDEHFASLYEREKRLGQMLLIATILSILIGCLGLLALSTFIIQQRTKEIGIRKVLGASVLGLLGLLSKDFLKLVLIALVIATPLSWYIMNTWLQDFAYRIEIQWWIFALAAIVSIVIAFITVSSQSLKAALTNPVDSLRNE
ncbi:MAG: FtsX-like permease family protein, partial [Bacteroidota bacterium]